MWRTTRLTHSPNKLVFIEKCRRFNARESRLQLVDKALNAQVGVLVQWQEVNSIEDIQNVAHIQLHGLNVLETSQQNYVGGIVTIPHLYNGPTGVLVVVKTMANTYFCEEHRQRLFQSVDGLLGHNVSQ